ncbi:periplasmic substrate-binding component of an ABC superfamily histidine transporter [Buttiauxella brennerae ATCC 51605]|uniref:Periplasmic substrate-binding component of an ABC superfamily histidine transporter n=1 Tax=Buttiauxella brennerae ATCC 51605 TaxID=1354251 RepID=A0A1B7IE19_9ENTR|nr:ABC transporter substrate-binding protein [Buttiauxella brennerae]OAT27539.1 periplasmic substrate-binding component of an ABC superfamily histidine transporter [Buttiauxella brennerae ATCC 51605]
MKKYILPLIALLATSSALANNIKEIRFGVDPTFAPFESKDASGKVVGFDIDLGNAICEKLQAKCVWVENNFDAIIPALQARKFDAILSGMYMTEKRKEQVAFSDKIYNGPVFLVANKNTAIKSDIEQLKGKTIGVEQGSAQETYANKNWRSAGVNVVAYQGADHVIQDLESGRIDGAVLSGVMAEYSFLKKPQGKDFAFVGGALQDPELFGAGAAIGLRKDDTELREAINSAISQILADGTYKKLAAKYFSFDIYSGT